MYKGKYSRERRRRPALWAALALALVLTLSVGGTVAYLFTNTKPVVNTFTPGNAEVTVVEEFENNIKSSITVKNTGNIDVYVRVMLVASYQNDEGVCATHANKVPSPVLPEDALNTEYWVKGADGYYYYKTKLAGDKTTESLLANGKTIELNAQGDCCKMHVDVLAQAIQAEPDSAVTEAWKSGVSSVSNGTLTVKTTKTTD